MAELNFGGVFFPAFLLWVVVAFAANAALRRLLDAIGFYRIVWHRALFDLALFTILLGGIVRIASDLVGP